MYRPTKKEWAWATYDFGNSAYALIVMTIFFPLFFAEYVAPSGLTTLLWGVATALSLLVAGLISPLLGAFTDREAKRKSYFVLFSVIAIVGTMVLPSTAVMPWALGLVVFVVVNASFGLSLSLYDSFIAVVPKNRDVSTTVSGIGWAVGYLGGPLCLLLAFLVLGQRLPASLADYRTLFLVTGIFFFLCSVWPFMSLPQDSETPKTTVGLGAFRTVWRTLRLWRTMRHIFLFLLAMYFLMDGLTTMVYFVALFAKEALGFNTGQIVLLLLLVQGVGVLATAIISWIAEKVGEIRVLIVCSGLWIVISILIYFSRSYESFVIIAALTGLVIGSTPAIARGFLGKNIPKERRAELFGFNTFAGRIATLLGPLIYSIASVFLGMRTAIFTVLPFFIVGGIILLYLKANLKKWQHA